MTKKAEIKKRKSVDLTDVCIKALSKAAIDKGTVFKLYVEDHLEKLAHSIKK